MTIRFLHTESCHVWQKALVVLEETLSELNLEVSYEVILIKTQKDADNHKFGGSPTIQIDGFDVDPMAQGVTKYTLSSCRNYVYQNKFYEYPPKEMVLAALKRTAEQK